MLSGFMQHPGCIPSRMVELSSHDRKHEALEAKMMCYLVFYENLQSPIVVEKVLAVCEQGEAPVLGFPEWLILYVPTYISISKT